MNNSNHQGIMTYTYQGKTPVIPKSVFVAPNATVIGDVEIGEHASIWFNAVLRGDVNYIKIGARTNIQDGCVLHVSIQVWPLHIGSNVTVGHGAILHGCTIEDHCLIGMGARVLDGARIGEFSLVAAGSLVREGDKIPKHSLVAGVPAVVKRTLSADEIRSIERSADRYVGYNKLYQQGNAFRPADRRS
ncbi:MAG: gamma carbonic anhydrase family protein [bacterium]